MAVAAQLLLWFSRKTQQNSIGRSASALFASLLPPVSHVQDEQRTLQTLNDRLAMQRLKKADLEKRIRELGSLPDDAFEKYRGHGLKRLQQELAQVGWMLLGLGVVAGHGRLVGSAYMA